MFQLKTMTVPLDSVEVQPHRQMENVTGFVAGFSTPPRGENPIDVAMEFVAANREIWGESTYSFGKGGPAAPGPASTVITPSRMAVSPIGFHVELGQTYNDIPLQSSTAVVHMNKERSVHLLTNDLTKDSPALNVLDVLQKGVSQLEALAIVSERLRLEERLETVPSTKLALTPDGGQWRLAWRVDLALAPARKIDDAADRSSDLRVLVDIETGKLSEILDRTAYVAGTGRVFNPNPIVALRQDGLAADATMLNDAYSAVKLSRLDGSGYLSGHYADTCHTPNRVHQPDGLFDYDRSHPGFEEVMAYHFVDQVMDWLRRLGWPDLFSRPLNINAHAPIGDNSKFLPSRWAMHLGNGGVNDAEDASIILHELGHAIQDAQVQGWGDCPRHRPARAMGEGFADFLSAVYFAEERHDFHTGWLGDWDARGYPSPRSYLRCVTEDKTMADWADNEHKDGEIWSAALWDLFLATGGDAANPNTRKRARSSTVKLVLLSHHYLSDGNRDSLTFGDGVKALLTADQFLSADPTTPGPHGGLIRDIFAKRGMSPS